MSIYAPLFYNKLNRLDNSFFPNTQKRRNNLSFGYWQRSLFQRACSTIEFELPENWSGSIKDFFYYCLFRFGFVCVFYDPIYGLTFQPCTLKGYDIYYQENTLATDKITVYVNGIETNISKNLEPITDTTELTTLAKNLIEEPPIWSYLSSLNGSSGDCPTALSSSYFT